MPLPNWLTGFKPLTRNPRFAATVIVVLALSIGINVATLGLLYRYYVSPLPYAQGDRIVDVHFASNLPGSFGMSVPAWQSLRKKSAMLADSGIYNDQGYNLVLGNRESHLNGTEATASVFSTLGVQPMLGRVFGPDSNKPGSQPVVVLSYGLWQQLFGGKRSAIGKTLKLNGKLFTVIGVMPKRFNFPTARAALWTPRIITASDQNPGNFTSFIEQMIGRLKPGASIKTFTAQANATLKDEIGPNPYDLRVAAQGWRSSQIGNLHQSLVLVLCATALLMLLVWFNLANLFLARAFARRSELILRRILDANSRALFGLLARENFLLSLVGAGLGVVFGRFLLDLFSGSSVAVAASSISAVSWPALIVIALILALISAAIFTLTSLGFLRGNDLSAALGDAGARASPGRGTKRVRRSLIAGQIALACAIAGTGLLLGRGLLNLNAVRLGFQPEHAVTFKMSFPESQYPLAKMTTALGELRTAVSRLPGMNAVSVSSEVPFDGSAGSNVVFPRPANPNVHPSAFTTATDAGYLKALGLTLLRGRNFTPADANNGTSFAIIDTIAANQLFGTEHVVGREFSFYSPSNDDPGVLFRVIGVVSASHRSKVGVPPKGGSVYVDFPQVFGLGVGLWYQRDWYLSVRSHLPAATLVTEVKSAARNVIPGVPLYDVQTMNQRLAGALASNRLLTVLVLLFAIGALVLAAIGLYTVQAYAVAQRAREFAIRAALGADRSRLLAMVLGETARLLVIGLVVGLAGLAGIGMAFASAFYGIAAVDPTSMVIVAVVLALAALGASWFPAWRASRVAPDKALRS